jgi:hypothetical protein
MKAALGLCLSVQLFGLFLDLLRTFVDLFRGRVYGFLCGFFRGRPRFLGGLACRLTRLLDFVPRLLDVLRGTRLRLGCLLRLQRTSRRQKNRNSKSLHAKK